MRVVVVVFYLLKLVISKEDYSFTQTDSNYLTCLMDSLGQNTITNWKSADNEVTGKEETYFRIAGITSECVIYLSWYHLLKKSVNDIYNYNLNVSSIEEEPIYLHSKKLNCHDHHIFQIKTGGPIQRLLLVVVHHSGSRVILHSAISGKTIKLTEKMMWRTFVDDYRVTHQSTSVPRGYRIDDYFSILNRIFIWAFSSENKSFKIFELKVLALTGNTMKAYIEKTGVEVPIAVMPFNKFEKLELVVVDNMVVDGHLEYGLIVMKKQDMIDKEYSKVSAIAIPLSSLYYGTLDGVVMNYKWNGDIYTKTTDGFNFSAKYPKGCNTVLNHWMIVDFPIDNELLGTRLKKRIPTTESAASGYLQAKFINSENFHRRMAYPHAFNPPKRHDIRLGWEQMGFIILSLILLLFILYKIPYLNVRKINRCWQQMKGKIFNWREVILDDKVGKPPVSRETTKSFDSFE